LEKLRDTATLLPKLLDLLFAEIPAKQGAVLIADEGGRELERSFFRGNPFAINKDVAEWAFRKRTAVLQRDSAAVLCAPTCLRRSTVGAIYLESGRLGAFTEDHLRLLALVATEAAGPIDAARYADSFQEQKAQFENYLGYDHS